MKKQYTLQEVLINNPQDLKYTEAEPLCLREFQISEKVLGTEHPLTAMSLNNLAKLYKDQGKYEKAEAFYLRALDIWEKKLGIKHPWTIKLLVGKYLSTISWKSLRKQLKTKPCCLKRKKRTNYEG
jgi:tetratricopeptide (TPR) repeat protein